MGQRIRKGLSWLNPVFSFLFPVNRLLIHLNILYSITLVLVVKEMIDDSEGTDRAQEKGQSGKNAVNY